MPAYIAPILFKESYGWKGESALKGCCQITNTGLTAPFFFKIMMWSMLEVETAAPSHR